MNKVLTTGEQVDERDAVDDDLVHAHTLGAGVGVETLDRVQRLERRVGERVHDLEQEVRGEGTLREALVRLGLVDLLRVRRLEACVDRKADRASERTRPEDRAAGHPVGEEHTGVRASCGDEGNAEVEHELKDGVVAEELENLRVEVAETVTGELAEDAHEDDLEETPAGVLVDEETGEVPPAGTRIWSQTCVAERRWEALTQCRRARSTPGTRATEPGRWQSWGHQHRGT